MYSLIHINLDVTNILLHLYDFFFSGLKMVSFKTHPSYKSFDDMVAAPLCCFSQGRVEDVPPLCQNRDEKKEGRGKKKNMHTSSRHQFIIIMPCGILSKGDSTHFCFR